MNKIFKQLTGMNSKPNSPKRTRPYTLAISQSDEVIAILPCIARKDDFPVVPHRIQIIYKNGKTKTIYS